jgi:hypothetical protein
VLFSLYILVSFAKELIILDTTLILMVYLVTFLFTDFNAGLTLANSFVIMGGYFTRLFRILKAKTSILIYR